MTDGTRATAFGAAALAAEILGWILLLGGTHIALGLASIIIGTFLWGGMPAVADTRLGRGSLLGLQDIRDRVQGWESREK